MNKKFLGVLAIILGLPSFAFADIENFQGLVNALVSVLNSMIPLFFGIAILAFFWGVIHYIWAADPAKLEGARNYMIFSIIGIAVMLSVWGLALLVKNSFFPTTPPVFNPLTGQVGSGGGGGTPPGGSNPFPPGNECTRGPDCQSGVCNNGYCELMIHENCNGDYTTGQACRLPASDTALGFGYCSQGGQCIPY